MFTFNGQNGMIKKIWLLKKTEKKERQNSRDREIE